MRLNYDPNKSNITGNNYFVNMERKFGDDSFIVNQKPDQIQRAAKERIFREMVKGQIDYSLQGKYFCDTKFLENLLIAGRDELNNNINILNALTFYDLHNPGNSDIINLKAKYNILCYVFQNIVSRLEAVKMSGNIGYLTDIQYVLGQYRNSL